MAHWLISKIDPRPSQKVPGSICYHIKFINIENQQSAKTYVESSFYNYQNWREIVENSNLSCIVSNITANKGIVNADSRPTVEIAIDPDTMAEHLAEHWDQPSPTRKGDLFE